MTLTVGLGGVSHHACAALSTRGQVLGVCEQERITRIRGAGCNPSGIPDEALDALLAHAQVSRADIGACALAEDGGASRPWPTTHLNHHKAHACASYLTSPFESAIVLICDHEAPGISVWSGRGAEISPVEWPWVGSSLSDLYTECAGLLGFASEGGDQRFEALARLMVEDPDPRLPALFSTDGTRIEHAPGWRAALLELGATANGNANAKARMAAAVQRQIGGLLVDLLRAIRKQSECPRLCVGGSLFFHSSLNTVVRNSGLFERVFVPANPGNAGLSVGSAMQVSNTAPVHLSAFMGPSYDPDTIKWTLDNCKLSYTWLDEAAVLDVAVRHLAQGRLVGWFEGRMEWGPRALGARSILASPFAPYVLENLNHFLKRREPWRGYGLSALCTDVEAHFAGPLEARFMECDYRPHEIARFAPVMSSNAAHLRIQTVADDSPPRFRALLDVFKAKTGFGGLVNTSFNGFHEPIVCTPRDAVRVFFGSGLDVLILEQFVLTK